MTICVPYEIKKLSTMYSGIEILEISFGEFDENDIERIEDVYNRG